MFKATKDGRTMTLLDSVQAAAFEKSGWEVRGADKSALSPAPEPVAIEEPGEPSLKEQADALGIKYHPNIGDEKLAAKIAEVKGDG